MISPKQKLPRLWLNLAIASLAIAGLFSLPPVILRGPAFSSLDIEHIFATTLVIHVDLSVLVWFLALAAMCWSLMQARYTILHYTAFSAATFGTLLMVAGAFATNNNPLKNNYVPMLNNPWFIWGLDLFAAGILLQLLITLFTPKENCKTSGPLCFIPVHTYRVITAFLRPIKEKKDNIQLHIEQGIYSAAIITLIAFICFIITYFQMPSDFTPQDGEPYYELLFWGGGHILQFTFIQLLLISWLWLASAAKLTLPISSRSISFLLSLNILFVLPAPFIYIFYNVGDGLIRGFFTQHMRTVGAISAIIMGLSILSSLIRFPASNKTFVAALWLSIILFFSGGIISLLITGNDAQVPAHYHGSIIGITTALMGVIYYLLPRFGYLTPSPRTTFYQLLCYGGGQLFHITGLAWMGGYGALRKAPNSLDSIDHTLSKIFFFTGGSFAILGGLAFVVIAYYALHRHSNTKTT